MGWAKWSIWRIGEGSSPLSVTSRFSGKEKGRKPIRVSEVDRNIPPTGLVLFL